MAEETKKAEEAKESTEFLLVQSKVKDYVKKLTHEHPFHSTDSFMLALNEQVKELILKAVKRCNSNSRSTLNGRDV